MIQRERTSKAKAKAVEMANAGRMRAIHAQYADLIEAIEAEAIPALRLILLDQAQEIVSEAEALQLELRRGGCRRAGFVGLRAVKASLSANRDECLSAIARSPLPGLPQLANGGMNHG